MYKLVYQASLSQFLHLELVCIEICTPNQFQSDSHEIAMTCIRCYPYLGIVMCMLISVKISMLLQSLMEISYHNYTIHPLYYSLIPTLLCMQGKRKKPFIHCLDFPWSFVHVPQPTKPKRHRLSRHVHVWALSARTNQAQRQCIFKCNLLLAYCNPSKT